MSVFRSLASLALFAASFLFPFLASDLACLATWLFAVPFILNGYLAGVGLIIHAPPANIQIADAPPRLIQEEVDEVFNPTRRTVGAADITGAGAGAGLEGGDGLVNAQNEPMQQALDRLFEDAGQA